eukprot:scaffold316258_cov32-Tisochrysis_lutea.AAC.1
MVGEHQEPTVPPPPQHHAKDLHPPWLSAGALGGGAGTAGTDCMVGELTGGPNGSIGAPAEALGLGPQSAQSVP